MPNVICTQGQNERFAGDLTVGIPPYTIEYMKKQEGPKQVVVCTRVPEKVKEALEAMAHKKGVNLGEFLRWHLIEFADRQVDRNCLLYTSPSPRDRQKSRMP